MGNAQPRRPYPSQVTVHPHVHGERFGRALLRLRFCRFIPTCMGNAREVQCCAPGDPVHPHVHGERECPPERVRLSDRFIPTCMGNASRRDGQETPVSVHPHVHGERNNWVHEYIGLCGSSPRAWGTPDVREIRRDIPRFIPTCMGNAGYSPQSCNLQSVHPHVHGKRRYRHSVVIVLLGSSPRAWGTHALALMILCIFRFIPTCMGNAHLTYEIYH